MTAKEEVIEFVRRLPEDATYSDVRSALDAKFGDLDEDGRELTEDEWEAAWVEEAERRLADARAGKTVGVPHEEVMRRMREKYG